MFCNFRGECKCTPNGKNCMNSTPEETINIVEVIITFARHADVLRGAVVLQFCGSKEASKVMLPKLKKRMKIIGRRNQHTEQELVAHVSLRMHKLMGLLHKIPPAVRGLQGLSPAVFVICGSFGSVENNGYSGFDDHTPPNA